jgi:DHA1 family multidrug resistance protein-like MFS transporter
MTDETAATERIAIEAEENARATRATFSIAAAVGLSSMSFNFWFPFLPLFMIELGAKNDADAVFWVGLATAVQGITRLIVGPVWGVLSDRFGRKLMFLRALYFGTLTTMIMAFVTEPWHVAIAFACQGLFSGFVPASVALTSVSVPDSRLNSSLSLVTGAQYLGTTVGPAVGAVLAIVFGYRSAIFLAALLPAVIATAVIFFVPADRVAGVTKDDKGEKPALEPFRPNLQFVLAVFFFMMIFAMAQLLRIVTPVALQEIEMSNVEGITGVTFTLGGLASAVAVLVLAQRFFGAGRLRKPLIVSSVLTGAAHLVLALTGTVPLFVLGYTLISLLQAAMIPATNTLIAANVTRGRRGTAFGIASSAQAVAFMIGPMAAALFAAVSLDLGFIVLGGVFIGLGLLLLVALREPRLEGEAVPAR